MQPNFQTIDIQQLTKLPAFLKIHSFHNNYTFRIRHTEISDIHLTLIFRRNSIRFYIRDLKELAEYKAGQGCHDNHQGYIDNCFLRSQNPADDQHVRKGQ